MKRFHIHISVDDLARNIRYYSALFAAQPTVTKDDYAKWLLDDPRINFAISQRSSKVGLNHLGLQVDSSEELAEVHQRLQSLQTEVIEQQEAACCYAKSDKYWVNDPQGIAWESFHTLDAIPIFGDDHEPQADESACCVPIINETSATKCCTPKENTHQIKSTNCC